MKTRINLLAVLSAMIAIITAPMVEAAPILNKKWFSGHYAIALKNISADVEKAHHVGANGYAYAINHPEEIDAIRAGGRDYVQDIIDKAHSLHMTIIFGLGPEYYTSIPKGKDKFLIEPAARTRFMKDLDWFLGKPIDGLMLHEPTPNGARTNCDQWRTFLNAFFLETDGKVKAAKGSNFIWGFASGSNQDGSCSATPSGLAGMGIDFPYLRSNNIFNHQFISINSSTSPDLIAGIASQWTGPSGRLPGRTFSTTLYIPIGGTNTAYNRNFFPQFNQACRDGSPILVFTTAYATKYNVDAEIARIWGSNAVTLPPTVTPAEPANAQGTPIHSGTLSPAAIEYLATACPTAKAVTLVWRSPGKDHKTGAAVQYDVRYANAPITPSSWATAARAPRAPKPAPAGSAETLTLTGLTASTTYYFAIKAADALGNWSPLSPLAKGATLAQFDATPPAAVTNLAAGSPTAGSVELTWTAPADPGGNDGVASEYDIRYSASPISASNWESATQVARVSNPNRPGSKEKLIVADLSPSKTYYFALKTVDEGPNWSDLSNVASGTTLAPAETIPPAAIRDLSAGSPTPTSLTLTWTAPGDNGNTGKASKYDIRYATSPITESNWGSALRLEHRRPTPKPAGGRESYLVIGLSPDSSYYFAIKTADKVPNLSALSNVASGKTSPAEMPSSRKLFFHEGAVFPNTRLAPINPPYLITWLGGTGEQPHETAIVSSSKYVKIPWHEAVIQKGKLPWPYGYAARNDPKKPEVTDTQEKMYAQYLTIAQQGFYGMCVDEYAVRDYDTRAQESIDAIRQVKKLFPNFLVGVWFYAGGNDPVMMDSVIAGGTDVIDCYTAELYIYPERDYREVIGRCVDWIKYYGLEGKTTMITSGRPAIYKGRASDVDLRIKYLRALCPPMASLGVQIFKLYGLSPSERAAYDAVMDENFFKLSPTVSITSPAQGVRVNGTVSIQVKAAPNVETRSQIVSYRYFVDTKLVKISPRAEYSWNTAGYASGPHVITVHAAAEDWLAGVAQVDVTLP